MISILMTVFLALTPSQVGEKITKTQKQEFIKLLSQLPVKGEFYTDEAVKKAGPYLPVLFALTEKEVKESIFYSFGAISRGL